jgi:Fic family protein
MVTIERNTVKNKQYYRLVHTIRKGKKTTHKTKYIGKILPTKKVLDKMKEELLREIKEGKYTYLSQVDVERIENKRKAYQSHINKLSITEKDKQLQEFMIRFTYDSSKLAGVNITLRQTSLILKDGIVPKDFKDLKAIKEVENHKKGIVAITAYKGKLDIFFLKKLHKILFLGVDDTIAGTLRSDLQRNVKIAGTPYVPPPWQLLSKELNVFFSWYRSVNRRIHSLELAALIHLRLITMQPFVDGNSRLSRLLMNWILWKKGYPLIDIPVGDLEKYYNVLDKYQIEKNEKPFVSYITKKYLEEDI